jgi:DNA-binding response OmpR family regulator
VNDGRKRRVLVVDDEPMVPAYLRRAGFLVEEAGDAAAALRAVQRTSPDLIVLDVMLPGADGLSILGHLRRTVATPVILLTARTDEADRVTGLDLGADDYVTKPFSPRELAARVRSVLRRSLPAPPQRRLEFDGLVVDGETREVRVSGRAAGLTPREFELLAFLAASPRRVYSRAELLEQVWDSSPDYQDPSTVTVHVRRIRRKIEHDPEQPRWVQTVWGVGYRFEP